jgi:RimJ/RimL family protein N-acetyltransferase
MADLESEMIRLDSSQLATARKLYLDQGDYFPIIASVLNGDQDGVVFVDQARNPMQVYVEHSFGFAQTFGKPVPVFEKSLECYLLIDRPFSAARVMLYTPNKPSFLLANKHEVLRSWRQHFQLDTTPSEKVDYESKESPVKHSLVNVDSSHLAMIEEEFGVVNRFWKKPEDFFRFSNGVLALVEGRAVALCYAAAVSGGRAEIDVMTLADYRNLGLANAVVRAFNRRCLEQNVVPLWDCFVNNTASMALRKSAGFKPLGEPYPVFTFRREQES